MGAIQDEQEWGRTVGQTLDLIAAFERGEVEMPQVWYDGVSRLGWPREPGDAPWRLAYAGAIDRIAELGWLLDGTVAAIVSGDASPGEVEEGEALLRQVREELFALRPS